MADKKSWMRYKPNEVEKLVIKEAKHGKKPSLIGMALRDSYGIPDVHQITGKNITQILEENKLNADIPEDLFYIIKKAINIREHMEHNKKDVPAKRSLLKIEAKIRKLVKYYIKQGKLPKDWKYVPSKVKLLLH